MLSPPSWRRSLLPGVLCLSTRPDRTPCASFPRHRRRLSSCQEQAAQRKRSGMKGHERWPWAALGGLGPASGRAQLRGRRCARALQPPERLDLPASSPHSHEAVLLHGAPVPRTWRVHVEGTRGGHTWKAHVEDSRLRQQQEAGRFSSQRWSHCGGVARGFPGVTFGLAPEELFLSAVLEAEAAWPQDSRFSLGAFVLPPRTRSC